MYLFVDVSIFIAQQHTIQLKEWLTKESLGQLVVLGFAIAGFTPAPYQRCLLYTSDAADEAYDV